MFNTHVIKHYSSLETGMLTRENKHLSATWKFSSEIRHVLVFPSKQFEIAKLILNIWPVRTAAHKTRSDTFEGT